MVVSVGVKLSSEPGNALSFGSDNGVFGSGFGPRGGTLGWTIDNSWASAAANTPYYYALPALSTSSITMTAGTAIVWPFMVSRNCRVTNAGLYVNSAGAGSQLCTSLFAANPDTGAPAAKLSDLLRWDTTATGVRTPTVLDAAAVLYGNTLYWLASWAYTTSAMPNINTRYTSSPLGGMRLSGPPTVPQYFSSGFSNYLDTSVAWSGLTAAPATLNPTQPNPATAPGTPYMQTPFIWWGLLNI